MVNSKPEVSPDEEQRNESPLHEKRASFDECNRYEIVVKGYLEAHWADWLGGLSITHDAKGDTHLIGVVTDQAALHGILAQIRDMGLTLVSLTPQSIGVEDSRDTNELLNEDTTQGSG